MKLKINTQLFLDLTLCGLFTLISMFIMSFFFPEGITTKFLHRSSKLIGILFIVFSIFFLIYWYFDKNFNFKKKFYLPKLKDFLLLALPMSPVINYALTNIEYLDTSGLLYLFTITLLFVIFFSIIIPFFFSYLGSFYILMIVGLALTYTILNLAEIANDPNNHIFNSQFITQGSYLIFSFLIIYLLYLLNKVAAYTFAIVFMISGVVVNFYNYNFEKPTKIQNQNKIIEFLNNNNNKIIKKKNIYILVYESYSNSETLNYYGFDNTNQIDFLEENGFTIYDGIYSVSSSSLASTSRILEINGELSNHARHYVSGNAFVPEIFKKNGYKTIGLFNSSYFLSGSSPINWDEYYPKDDISKLGGKTLTKAIFQGEFNFDIFDDSFDYDKYLILKNKYLSSKKKNTLFYTHNSYPGHSGNSGKCRSDEKKSYFKGMKKANLEMKKDILDIMSNDKESIIVLVGDHGPYLTKNCKELRNYNIKKIDKYDVQDRYGAFLSIFWPEDISKNDNNIQITQDIFPSILSKITNNKKLFDKLKLERKFFDRFNNVLGGVSVYNGVVKGGKDDKVPLFNIRSYALDD